MSLAPGTRLGPYQITEPLGAGGMGEVYKARDTRLDRTVAVKVLSASLAENAQFRERFEREARAVSSLNHPHICVLHDIGREDGAAFLVMELLEGESLAARVQRGPLPADQALATPSRLRKPWTPRTAKACCTATSSQPTSSSPGTAPSCSISVWRKCANRRKRPY